MRTNYPAVVVAAIVYWLLGGLWYGALFSQRLVNLEPMIWKNASQANPMAPYVISFLLELLIAYSLAQLCIWRNANTMGRGASIGVLMWIGFVGPISFMNYMFEMRQKEVIAIHEFYPLLGLVLMGAILGAWKKKIA